MAMRDKALSVITNCHGDGEQAYPDCNIDCLAGRGKLYVEGANEVLWRQIWGSAQNQIKDASIVEYERNQERKKDQKPWLPLSWIRIWREVSNTALTTLVIVQRAEQRNM